MSAFRAGLFGIATADEHGELARRRRPPHNSAMSDDDRDEGHPARDALAGLGLLFRAGRGAARKIKKEIDRSNLGRSIDDAGKELARAVDNVVGRIAGEPKPPPPDAHPGEQERGADDGDEKRG